MNPKKSLMNKIFLGSLVGGIILFGWQSLSWTSLGVHDNTFQYTPAQDSLIRVLEQSIPSNGTYLVPSGVPGTTEEEKENLMKSREGKPWAIISFHNYYQLDMIGPVIRGFLTAILCVLLLCLNVQQFHRIKWWKVLLVSVSYGLVSFLFISYNDHIWFSTPWTVLSGQLIDCLAGWGLCGVWLGLWFSRK